MNKPKLIMLVAPPGAGKSTLANDMIFNGGDHGAAIKYINQDSQGKDGHIELFRNAIHFQQDIIVDRMNFNKEQRNRYLSLAKEAGYETQIIVLHIPYAECLKRCVVRKDHETIKDETIARKALNMFFNKYERVQDDEADKVERRYPEGIKQKAFCVDLDGTLCNIDHRLHYVRDGKKDWKGFFKDISKDTINLWCKTIIKAFHYGYPVQLIYCSGRGSEYRNETIQWLKDNDVYWECVSTTDLGTPKDIHLYMRQEKDYRQDFVIKEQILDFELLTRFDILFAIDDRQQVVDLWRRRGITALQCAKGDF